MSLVIEPIAQVVSPYKEKFGIPRQPGLVEHARGYLQMSDEYADPAAFEGMEGFSHLWIIFEFHACEGRSRLRVRPPRLGGNQEMGVFATRSPFRPNNLGLSVLRYEGLKESADGLCLQVSGLDLLHDTPVYDIKPYVPYTDSMPNAQGGFAASRPQPHLKVVFSGQAEERLSELPSVTRLLIEETLRLDPRPAYRQGESSERVYGVRLENYDVRWRVQEDRLLVDEVLML